MMYILLIFKFLTKICAYLVILYLLLFLKKFHLIALILFSIGKWTIELVTCYLFIEFGLINI